MWTCCLRCALHQFGENRGSPLPPSTFPSPQVIDKINDEIEELDEQLNESVQQAMRDKLREKVGVRGGGGVWGYKLRDMGVEGRECAPAEREGERSWQDSVVRANPPRPSSHMAACLHFCTAPRLHPICLLGCLVAGARGGRRGVG